MTPRELHKQAMKLRIEAGKLDAEAIRLKERMRIIKLLEDEGVMTGGGLVFSNFILQREFKLSDGSDVVLLNDVFEAMGKQLDVFVALIKGETE